MLEKNWLNSIAELPKFWLPHNNWRKHERYRKIQPWSWLCSTFDSQVYFRTPQILANEYRWMSKLEMMISDWLKCTEEHFGNQFCDNQATKGSCWLSAYINWWFDILLFAKFEISTEIERNKTENEVEKLFSCFQYFFYYF